MSSIGLLVQRASCRSPRCQRWSAHLMLRTVGDQSSRFDQGHRSFGCTSCHGKAVGKQLDGHMKPANPRKEGNTYKTSTERPSDFFTSGNHELVSLQGLCWTDPLVGQSENRADIVTIGTSSLLPQTARTDVFGLSERNEWKMHAKSSNSASWFVLRQITSSLLLSPCNYITNSYRSFSGATSQRKWPWVLKPRYTDTPVSQVTVTGYAIPQRTMAGHSKWQNIRHIKSAKDGQRANIFSKLVLKIKIAVREGKSEDPNVNVHLARVLAQAKAKDMPNTTIASAIKAGGSKDPGSPFTVEVKGPGQCLWIVETVTDKPVRTKGDIRAMLKKYGCVVSEGNTVIRAFEKKGVVEVSLEEGEEVDMDKYLEVAIESGAEDIEKREDDIGSPCLAFVCDVDDLHSVKKAVEGRELSVKSAYHEYVPRAPAVLPESEVTNLQVILEKLQGHPEVLRVFDNIQMQEA